MLVGSPLVHKATFVSEEDEIARVVPIIRAIKENYDCLVSIDTYKTGTACAALEAGADILNDVWAGLYDGDMLAPLRSTRYQLFSCTTRKKKAMRMLLERSKTF